MSSDVDAVIAALRIVLRDAEQQTYQRYFETHVVNKWIGQLPGAWSGRWRRLRLLGNHENREVFLTHLRATLAYLEVNRDQIKTRRSWPDLFRARWQKPKPIDAEFREVTDLKDKPTKKTGKSVRLISPER